MSQYELVERLEYAIMKAPLDEGVKSDLSSRLHEIRHNLDCPKLCFGLVSMNNTLKAELLSAMFGDEFFDQEGIYSQRFHIRYGANYDLEISYKEPNRPALRYTQSKDKLLKAYMSNVFENLSVGEKMKISALGFIDKFDKDDLMVELFKALTQKRELDTDIKNICLYIPSERLRDGIEIVNLPKGAEISALCDIPLVLLRSDNPLPSELVDYLRQGAADTQAMTFAVTKTALLVSPEKIKEKAEEVKAKIKDTLGFTEANVIPVDETSEASVETFSKILCEIKDRRTKTAVDTAIQRYVAELKTALNAKYDVICNELNEINSHPLTDIVTFVDAMEIPLSIQNYLQIRLQSLKDQTDLSRNAFLQTLMTWIDDSTTKNETQGVMKRPETINYGNALMERCFTMFQDNYVCLTDYAEAKIDELDRRIYETYKISVKHTIKSAAPEPKWKVEYKQRFKKRGMTTVRFLRMFVSKETIKKQTRKAVEFKLYTDFGRMFMAYHKRLVQTHDTLQKAAAKILASCKKDYAGTVTKLIAQQNQRRQQLEQNRAIMIGIIQNI